MYEKIIFIINASKYWKSSIQKNTFCLSCENEYARALHYNKNIKMILHTHENDKKNQFDLIRSK